MKTIKSSNSYVVLSLCGKYKRAFDDYNKAIIAINDNKWIYYLGKII